MGRTRIRGVIVDVSAMDVMDSFSTRALDGIPGSTAVRGSSMSGMAYLDVVFSAPGQLPAGRQAIVERVARQILPPGVRLQIGPLASSTLAKSGRLFGNGTLEVNGTLQVGGLIDAIGDVRISGTGAFAMSVLASLIADLAWFWAGRRFGYPVLRFLCRVSLSPDTCG